MNYHSYKFFKVMSNKTRWDIIISLYNSNKSVNKICEDTKYEQSKISHNLKILLDCKIVFNKKYGKKRIYSLNKKTIRPIIDILKKHENNFCIDCPYKNE